MIPGRLLASAYPADRNEAVQRVMTEQFIVHSSIEVIVNLMEEEELKSFTPYRALMLEYAQSGSLELENGEHLSFRFLVQRDLEFLSFPIRDGHIHEDHQAVLQFSLGLCQRLQRGQKILIHCWSGRETNLLVHRLLCLSLRGGHGRTGTIVAILIGLLFHLKSKSLLLFSTRESFSRSGDEAIKINRDLHDQRVQTNGAASPESQGRRDSLFQRLLLLRSSAQLEQVRIVLERSLA